METLSPSDYVALMNLYLRTASDFLVDVGGYLDECSGESLRVIFGVPLPVDGTSNHASKAARASLDLVSRLEELNRACDSLWQKRLDFRIGLNSGGMIAAAYGGARMGRYSVSGPVVEFAHHLSAACAQYGCRILSGPTTYELASDKLEGRPIDLLQRAGSRRRVELYEFLAAKNSLSPERERSRDHFWKGVIFFRERKWEEAIRAFSSARIPGIPDRIPASEIDFMPDKSADAAADCACDANGAQGIADNIPRNPDRMLDGGTDRTDDWFFDGIGILGIPNSVPDCETDHCLAGQ
jgi:adenylate cyclase